MDIKKGDFFMVSKFGKTKLLETTKLIVSTLVIVLVSLFGCGCNIEAKSLDSGFIPGSQVRLKLISVENETDGLEFQTFYGGESASSLVFPQTTFHFSPSKAIGLASNEMLVIKCCKGSFLPVFIQDGGVASGAAELGYEGPFYISMWMQYPQASTSSKINIRYLIKKGQVGTVGVRIGKKGDYRFLAYDNVKFVS